MFVSRPYSFQYQEASVEVEDVEEEYEEPEAEHYAEEPTEQYAESEEQHEE